MKKEEAWQIFQTNFWDNMLGNAIEDQNIANILFDGHVNHGRTGLRIMQRVLGIKVDGVVGDLTIAAINKANGKTLFLTYQQARVDFYKQIVKNKPSQQVFLEGWLRRIYSFKYEVDSNPK
jgi:lysozyme family protein